MEPQQQIHDFNPGIAANGLFWTIRIPDESVDVDLDDATASLQVRNRDIEDYKTLANALADGPSVEATVSFSVWWRGVKKRFHASDSTNRFRAHFIEDWAKIEWSACEKGFTFHSDQAHTSKTVFAEIGSERNGVFF